MCPIFRIFVLLLFAPFSLVYSAHAAQLNAGVAKVNITPGPGVPMWGFAARKGVSTGTLDPLFARVLVLSDGNARVALVTLDLGRSFGAASLSRLSETVRKSSGITGLVVTASHTHSGPRVQDSYPPGQIPQWETSALDKIAIAIGEASAQLVPVQIGSGYGSVFIGHNRIPVQPDGAVKSLPRNPTKIPTSPVDPTVGVVRLDRADGQPLAILVNYACHPVVFGHDNLQFSADFPAAMIRTVEKAFDKPPLCLFLQEAPGDINPYYAETPLEAGGEQMRNWTGEHLGEEAARVAKRIRTEAEPDGRIDCNEDVLSFHLRWQPEKFREGLLKVWGPALIATDASPITVEMKLPVVTIVINHRIAFMSMPGEPFVDLQIDWRNRCPLPSAFFMGYTNGYFGYVPTIKGATLPAYGGSSSTTWVEVGAGEEMVNRAIIRVYEDLGRLPVAPLEVR
jgi:neutral ceramidase